MITAAKEKVYSFIDFYTIIVVATIKRNRRKI
jgi:hypothetical protein